MDKKLIKQAEQVFNSVIGGLDEAVGAGYNIEVDRDFRGEKPRLTINLVPTKDGEGKITKNRRYPK